MGFTALAHLLIRPASTIQKFTLFRLGENRIGDDIIAIFFGALSKAKTLITFGLPYATLNAACWNSFFEVLQNLECSFKVLDLRGSNLDDDGFIALGNSLSKYNRITQLHLDNHKSIT